MKNKKIIYILITLIFIVILGVLSFDMEVEDKLIENEIEILEEISPRYMPST